MNDHTVQLILPVLLYTMLHVECSSSTFHHIQVGGPANKITTGEIHIDLPSESFQNLKFNITPYSLQHEYSPYYDQYSSGYNPIIQAQPTSEPYKSIPSKPIIQLVKESPVKVSYKPKAQEIYTPLPSIPKPVYSYSQVPYNQPSYTAHKVSYNKPSYILQPSHTSVPKPSIPPVQPYAPNYPHRPQAYQHPVEVSRLSPVKSLAPVRSEPAEGFYSAYPYPYQHTGYSKYTVEEEKIGKITDVNIEEEDRTEHSTTATPAESDETSKNSEESKLADETEIISEVFISSNQEENNIEREPKNLDSDIDDSNLNSIDSVTATTLLPSFIPIVPDDGLSTLNDNLSSTESIIKLTTIQPTTKATITSSTTKSLIRRRPVISFFRDVRTSTQATSEATEELSDESAQILFNSGKEQNIDSSPVNKSDEFPKRKEQNKQEANSTKKIEITEKPTVTFTTQPSFQDEQQPTSTESVTPPDEAGQSLLNLLASDEEEKTDITSDIVELGNEETEVRNRRKVSKSRKPELTLGFKENYHWQDGR